MSLVNQLRQKGKTLIFAGFLGALAVVNEAQEINGNSKTLIPSQSSSKIKFNINPSSILIGPQLPESPPYYKQGRKEYPQERYFSCERVQDLDGNKYFDPDEYINLRKAYSSNNEITFVGRVKDWGVVDKNGKEVYVEFPVKNYSIKVINLENNNIVYEGRGDLGDEHHANDNYVIYKRFRPEELKPGKYKAVWQVTSFNNEQEFLGETTTIVK